MKAGISVTLDGRKFHFLCRTNSACHNPVGIPKNIQISSSIKELSQLETPLEGNFFSPLRVYFQAVCPKCIQSFP